jgi:RimJ/RimL family protein N-acetyltransferase
MNKIKLRALTLSDVDRTLEWNNQEDISNLYSGHPFPVNLEMEKKWYDKILISNYPVTVFGIEFIETKTLIGLTLLKDINLIDRNADFAIYIGDHNYRGKGLSKEATKKTLDFAFFKLGLNKVSLKVLSDNIDALSLYQKIGFIKEGVLRESVFKNNEFKSEIMMSILKNEHKK